MTSKINIMMTEIFTKYVPDTAPSPAPSRRSWLTWKKKLGLVVSLLLVTGVLVFAWWANPLPLLSPLNSAATFRFLSGETLGATSEKIVYGFLPYWNFNDLALQPELTTLSYFSLTIGGDGAIILQEGDHTEPGYNRLKSDQFLDVSSRLLDDGKRVDLVVSQFDNDDIVSFLNSEAAQDRFLDSLDSVLLAYPFSGVNIDIEYSGEVTDHLRQQLTTFVQKVNTHLDTKYRNTQLSIDMYAGAGTNYTLWDVAAIAPEVDYIIVMAYDFHRKSSTQAGPVAPLFGGKELWDSDISEHLAGFLKKVPSQKILLGVPFYGYGWQTTTRDAQSNTFPQTGSTATFKYVQELLAQKTELAIQENWNEEALSPYLTYEKGGETYIIYYENSRSLSYKLDFVNQLDLGGIAIWALGYEGDSRELWDVINRKVLLQQSE
ncbi:MAG TPA: glycosyl hydrolase family 18 protein [Patescibacteria group bacterium]